MTSVMFLTWLAVAVITGWVARAVIKSGGHGITADTLLAVSGGGAAVIATAAVGLFPGSGLMTAAVTFAGAGVVIAVQRRFFRAVPDGAHQPPSRRE